MPHEQLSSQCKMVQPTGTGGFRTHVAWVPKEFAVKGKWIRIDELEGNWQVSEVWGTKPEKWLVENERNYLKQRSVSDIKKAPDRKIGRAHMDQ